MAKSKLKLAEERIAALEAALRSFALLADVATPRMKIDPNTERLWSYYDSRNDVQYELTRAHLIEAKLVLMSGVSE